VKSSYIIREHYEVEGRIERISKLLEEAKKLKREIIELSSILKRLTLENDHTMISGLIDDIMEFTKITKLPLDEKDLNLVESNLNNYVGKLRSRLESLRDIVNKIRQLMKIVQSLKVFRSELLKWKAIMERLDTRVSIEIKRVLNSVDRYLSIKPEVTNLDEHILTLSDVLLESQDVIRLCKNVYERKINEIKKKVDIAENLYRQARQVVYLDELKLLSDRYKNVTEIDELLNELKVNFMKAQEVNFDELRMTLEEFIELSKSFLEKGMGVKEADLLKALNVLIKSKSSLPLHLIVDRLARTTNMSISDVLYTLYKLDKCNIILVKVQVKR